MKTVSSFMYGLLILVLLFEVTNAQWQSRREITILSTGQELTDFQVLVVLDTSNFNYSRTNSDGSDIRFSNDSTGNALLDLSFWIEKWETLDTSYIWVEVPMVPAAGDTAIYMYYNNPAATSKSDGANTFDFFDDFTGTSLDTTKWNKKGNGSVTIDSSVIHTNGEMGIYSKSNVTDIFNKYIEVRGKLRGSYQNDMEIGFGYISTAWLWAGDRTGEWITALGWDEKVLSIRDNNLSGVCGVGLSGTLWDYSDYFTYRVKFEPNRMYFWQEEALIFDDTVACSQTNPDLPVLIVFDHLSYLPNYDEYIDWIFVRKYAPTEVTASVGDETLDDYPLSLPTANLDSGLVAYYPFNGNANDESGNENHGTVNGALITSDRFGNMNSAYSFDGAAFIEIMDSDLLDVTNALALCAWINTTTTTPLFQSIVSKDGADHVTSYQLYIRDHDEISFYAGNAIHQSDSVDIDVDTWYFLVTQFTGSNVNHFVNGQLIYSEPEANNLPVTNYPVKIGVDTYSSHYFSGIIDDIRIYNRVLSEDEIDSLFIESSVVISVKNEIPGTPEEFALIQNYTNPFNPSTTIRFELPMATDVSVMIYDVRGRLTKELFSSEREAGYYALTWDGGDQYDRQAPSGLYIVRLITPEYTKSIKILLLK